jgi:hypothetical protein
MLSTGIRDTASASILNTLLELGKKLRKCAVGSPAVPEKEVRITLEKEFKQLLRGGKLDDTINPLLGCTVSVFRTSADTTLMFATGFNVHMDTPTEILHTILLGVVKYFWGQTVFLLEKSKLLHLFQIRLNSINKDGLKCSLPQH